MTGRLEEYLLQRACEECPFIEKKVFNEILYECMIDKGCIEGFARRFCARLRAANYAAKLEYLARLAEKYSVDVDTVLYLYEDIYNLSIAQAYASAISMIVPDPVPHTTILNVLELRLERGEY